MRKHSCLPKTQSSSVSFMKDALIINKVVPLKMKRVWDITSPFGYFEWLKMLWEMKLNRLEKQFSWNELETIMKGDLIWISSSLNVD